MSANENHRGTFVFRDSLAEGALTVLRPFAKGERKMHDRSADERASAAGFALLLLFLFFLFFLVSSAVRSSAILRLHDSLNRLNPRFPPA